jgi:iron complex transport system ATP-binding protein
MKLTVSGIGFSYNSHPVLDHISFTLHPGQLLCVLGINGAGKSTLLKCLNHILMPNRGVVLLGEDDLNRLKRDVVAKRIGYVPQHHPRNNMTVFEAVLLGRRPYLKWGLSRQDYQLTEGVIKQLGLEALAMRTMDCLSGGEIQKVVIARALAQSPKTLLLDEPTSNLDLRNQLEVMGLVRRIVDEQRLSAVVAIHDLNLAVRFGDAFLFLDRGRVYAIADKETLTEETIHQVYNVNVILRKIGTHTVVVPV